MNKITFEDYKNAIKAHYEAKKIEGVYGSGDISNITPAQLRDLCLYIAERGLTKTDESTFKFFFNANGNEKLGRAIENFGTGKLKSVISFLKGEKNSENRPRIELAAIIVDYNPRPYKRYSQIGESKEIDVMIYHLEEKEELVNYKNDLVDLIKEEVITKDWKSIKKVCFILMILISISFMAYTVKDIVFPTKECMQWNVNCYEEVDCSNKKLGIDQWSLIVPIDENTMKLKRLDSKAKLVFFRDDKPIVWYSKEDGVIELFNQPGFHPETYKPLKPITNYIIEKYKLKQK
jgi:integrase